MKSTLQDSSTGAGYLWTYGPRRGNSLPFALLIALLAVSIAVSAFFLIPSLGIWIQLIVLVLIVLGIYFWATADEVVTLALDGDNVTITRRRGWLSRKECLPLRDLGQPEILSVTTMVDGTYGLTHHTVGVRGRKGFKMLADVSDREEAEILLRKLESALRETV